jgi:hypothetical protein
VDDARRIRPSLSLRVYLWAFGAVWVAVLVPGVISTHDDAPFVSLLMAVLGGAFVIRSASAKVEVRPDGLFVRNVFQTWSFRWNEVQDFRVQRGTSLGWPFGRTVTVLLSNGEAVPLDATIRSHAFTGGHDDVVEFVRRLKISHQRHSTPPAPGDR